MIQWRGKNCTWRKEWDGGRRKAWEDCDGRSQGAGEGEGSEKPGHAMVQEGRERAWVSVKTVG